MKKRTFLLLIIAIAVTAVLIYCFPYFVMYRSAKVPNITYSGLSDVMKKLDHINPKLKQKDYYYFSSWNIRCSACIEEMPRLDSIADKLSPKIGFVYVSDDPDEKAKAFLKRKGIGSRNFTYLNDMNDFISAVYHSQGITYKVFPTHFVTDAAGNILIFKEGSISYLGFKKDHVLTRGDSMILEKLQDPIVTYLKNIH